MQTILFSSLDFVSSQIFRSNHYYIGNQIKNNESLFKAPSEIRGE